MTVSDVFFLVFVGYLAALAAAFLTTAVAYVAVRWWQRRCSRKRFDAMARALRESREEPNPYVREALDARRELAPGEEPPKRTPLPDTEWRSW